MEQALDVLAFGAHPDDIELMAGGTIIKLARQGYRVGMISLTRGEMGTRGTPEIRREEFAASAGIMGLAMHSMLDIPDGGVNESEENRLKVIREIRRWRPALLFAPYWETRHPDHAHCSHLVREAAFYSGLKKIESGEAAFRPTRLAYYCEHYHFAPSFVVDISDVFEIRLEAIRAYKSQVFNPDAPADDEERTHISSPEYFRSIYARAEYWGGRIGVRYGEPFLVREVIRTEDPFALLIGRAREEGQG
ncbi:MAG TPA: bacillithiol biosynthesis deacetylase BshB1 [bacterium]|nr:bacillithiol biosynthesis deacetylase BshB1 [bacterium]HOH05898.1 bacillithiol biosynthesis deacetylase BshB1 [bacterium]HPM59000.1 bacillithiol biosynthesis deacetylase BshB1 [bacterium]